MLFIGTDHRGFLLKETIKKFLDLKKIHYKDVGAFQYDKNDDYPDVAAKVAKEVSKNSKNLGILICGSGVGVCIAANKFKGVRAGTMFLPNQAAASKRDENTNVLCLSADYTLKATAKKIISVWLEVRFSTAVRHHMRVNKIRRLEH